MTLKLVLPAVGCWFALGAVPGVAAPARATPGNLLIVPGQHLGRIFLGDSKTTVHRRLGKPQRTFKVAGGLTSELWRSKASKDDQGQPSTLEVVYRRGAVVQIEATSATFKTAGGLSLRDIDTRWLKTYGEVRPRRYSYAKRAEQLYYDWPSKGLALETDAGEDDGVVDFYAYPHTVIVHRKGAKVVVDAGGRLVS